MAAEISLFNPPLKVLHKRAASSIRSIRSNKSSSSKASNASDKSYYCDLLGVRTQGKEPAGDASSPTLSSGASIASGATGSSTSSNASTATHASSKCSISLTEHDLFGTKLPPTEEELAPSIPDAVELESGKYKTPEPIDKQFFKDLTCLEDGELVRKYGLIQVRDEPEGQECKDGGVKKEGKLKRILEHYKPGVKEIV